MKANEWISVKDKLPKKDMGVLAWDSGDVYEAFLGDGNNWWAELDCITPNNITHWMPLPNPPKVK